MDKKKINSLFLSYKNLEAYDEDLRSEVLIWILEHNKELSLEDSLECILEKAITAITNKQARSQDVMDRLELKEDNGKDE